MKRKRQKVLIVDDIPSNMLILKAILGDAYDIDVAPGGREALKMIGASPPDLILLDILMPDLDGYEVCERLKADEKTRAIPIIFLTSLSEAKDETKGFEAGAVDYITKPFSAPVVKARVKTHLSLKRAHEELEARNRFIQEAFGRYTSNEVVDAIINEPDGLKLGGEDRLATILMADLRGFTAMAQTLDAEKVVDIINIYLETMTEVIFKHKGTITEFIGDAILVIFGAPVSYEDHALRSVVCALEMQMAMEKVNKKCRGKGYPEVAQGIGVNTGNVVVGNIGSQKRTKYGVVGYTVNLASRIESFTTCGQILISETTHQACGSILRVDDEMKIMPKGVKDAVTIYEIGGIGGDYNIFFPDKKALVLNELRPPVSIKFKVLSGKQTLEKEFDGRLIKFGDLFVDIRADRNCRKFSNLKITLLDSENRQITTELYGKVVEIISRSPHLFRVSFTFTPSEAKKFLETRLKDAGTRDCKTREDAIESRGITRL
ncbi:MAG: response regulator [Desulfobacterales bacterium]|nr:response regulator [Desulfobacterales bacterium]